MASDPSPSSHPKSPQTRGNGGVAEVAPPSGSRMTKKSPRQKNSRRSPRSPSSTPLSPKERRRQKEAASPMLAPSNTNGDLPNSVRSPSTSSLKSALSTPKPSSGRRKAKSKSKRSHRRNISFADEHNKPLVEIHHIERRANAPGQHSAGCCIVQ